MARKRKKVALALGSGGARGISHIGVIKHLHSIGMPIDMIAGSSMGSVIGLAYCAGRLGEFERRMMKLYRDDKIYSLSKIVVSPSGLTSPDRFINILKDIVHPFKRIEDLPIPLTIICTDYYTGRPVAFTKGDIFTAIRASIAVPGAVVPVRYGSTILIDGGVSNAVPVDAAKKMGADITIAVNVNPIHLLKNNLGISGPGKFSESEFLPMEDRLIPKNQIRTSDVKISSLKKEVPNAIIVLKRMLFIIKNAYLHILRNKDRDIRNKHVFFPKRKSGLPNIVEILWQTIDVMQAVNTYAMFEKNKPDVIIEPNVADVFPVDFTHIPAIVKAGRDAAKKQTEKLETILRKI